MIARLVLRDRALLGVAALWPGGAILGYMAAEAMGRAAQDGPIQALPGPLAFGFAVMWAVMASVNFLSGGGREVASRFHMALPIRGRDLWVARMITLYAPVGGAVALGFGVFLLVADEATRHGAAITGANALAIVAFVPALYHSARVRYAERGMPLAAFVPILVVSLGMYGIWGIGSPIPAAALGVASLALLVATRLRVPESFELAETAGGAASPSFPIARSLAHGLQTLPAVGSVLRMYVALRPRRWLNRDQFTLLVLLGASVNVLLLLRSPLSALVAPVIVQVAWLIRTVNGAARVDYLPIGRDRILRYALLPPFLVGLPVVVAGVAWSDTITWRLVAGSLPVAVAALLYVTIWALSVATVVGGMVTPNEVGSTRRTRQPVFWSWVGLIAILGFARWTGAPGPNVVLRLSQRLPLSVNQVWLLAGLVLMGSYVLTRRRFTRVEIVGLGRGLVT